jgi:uncharacterized protein with HEPN domain
MPKDDRARIGHMLQAAREIAGFLKGRKRADLDSDRLLLLALVKEVEIIGEAAMQTTEETRAKHPTLPWKEMAGMRNRLIHAYFDINRDMVWNTVDREIPALLKELERIRPEGM